MFALLDRQSFVRADGTRVTGAPTPGIDAHPGATTALSSVIRAIPSARSSRGVAGPLFTPADGIPAAPAEELSVLVVAGDTRRASVVASLTGDGVGTLVEAASSQDARACVEAGTSCDLAVVDLGLADGEAIDLVGELRDRGWHTVVLGGADDPADARAAFQAGALAFLLTSAPTGPAGPAGPSSPRPGAAEAASSARDLSAREVQVLQSVADGRTNAEIGEELELSALTVKSHLSRIGRKLGTGDRAGMVAVAMRAHLVH